MRWARGRLNKLFYFAGIWREWERDRGTKKAPNIGKHLVFSFLTPEPNGIVEPLRDKAMPVLIRTKEEAEQWLETPSEEALQLQTPAPDEAIEVLPKDKKS